MEYQKDIEMSPVPKSPNLKPNTEGQHQLWVLTFLKQIILQEVESGQKPHLS